MPSASQALYNGLESEIYEMMASLVPTSALRAMTPVDFCAGDVKAPKTYVTTTLDNGLPFPVREKFVGGTPGMKVVRLETGYSSFLVEPEKVVQIIVEAAGGGAGDE
jgi:hypothetical protein